MSSHGSLILLRGSFFQVDKIMAMMDRVRALGPGASLDVDQMALRITLDIIGLVSIVYLCGGNGGVGCGLR